MSAPGGGRLVAGVDEAGLGPLLGPLGIGWSVLRVPAPDADPWALLRGVVTREPSADRRRLVVDDSKRVFARNPRGRRRLEATVLAFLALLDPDGRPPACPRTLLFGGPELPPDLLPGHPWYARLPERLPLELEAGTVELAAFRLARRAREAGVALVDAGVRLVPSGDLNASYRRTGSKAATVWEATLGVVRALWAAHAAEGLDVVVDRQGGRARYGSLLARGLPDASVRLVVEDPGRSSYALEERGGPRRMDVTFVERAETGSFAVALGSCVAKYARELAMGAFNAYFAALQPTLRPTAGYRGDGHRWLAEAADALARAGVSRDVVVRQR